MLLQRVITALLMAPLVFLLILLPPTGLFALMIVVVFLSALWEWSRLSGLRNHAVRAGLLAVALVLFGLLWWLRDSLLWPLLLVLGVGWWVLACVWLRFYAYGAAPTTENRNLKLLAGVFVLFPAWIAAVDLHGSSPTGHWWPPAPGHWWMLLALLIVWAADIGAYFSGRFFGKRKLAPQISPGKTWAGVYGALVAGALVVAAGGWLLGVHDARLLGLVLVGLVTVAASIVGDLIESLMKRHGRVKDSGTLFPGHGGMLDRLDSVFAALPVFALGKWMLGL
jgi:phosphatidate cytidylyltransferase